MKRIFFFLSFIFSVLCISAQEYNIQGENALQRKDYQDARMWFSQGLDSCNLYSIRKLTDIWNGQPGMQASMRYPTMQKCFNCLKIKANSGETEAMYLLSDYYKQGIGVEKDSVNSEYWSREYGISIGLVTRSDTVVNIISENTNKIPKKSILSNRFYTFLAYTYSPTMPTGLTIGVFDKWGAYLSYRTSYETVNNQYTGNNSEVFGIGIENPPYQFNREKWTGQMITGGIFLPLINQKLYLSLGGGYGKRNYYREIITGQSFPSGSQSEWCHNTEASYKGAVVEAGGMYKWKRLIFTGGVNSTAFKDLDMYLGVGISF
ncbi:hypothetical protein FACS189420_7400 [Bacteroidia bacterium]|nr:hypothetical protein FACS189420_7400 [Bacteroidia bacterium]